MGLIRFLGFIRLAFCLRVYMNIYRVVLGLRHGVFRVLFRVVELV